MMNRIVPVITIVLCLWTQSLEGRPFDDHLKHWPAKFYRTIRNLIEPITAEESGPPPVPQRGSPEETRRILNEIKKINQAFGYTRKNPDIALPRQGPSGNSNYFYPRPVYQPAFIQNSKRPPYVRGSQGRHNRELGLYKKGTYFYPSQYLQLPVNFHPINYGVPYEGRAFKRPIVVEDVASGSDRIPKTMEELKTDMNGGELQKPTKLRQEGYSEYEDEEPIGIIESIVKIVAGPPPQEEEEEEGENYENYDSNEESNETEEDDERDQNIPTLNPPLLNDKFIHTKFKDGLNQDSNVPEARSFNFTTPNFIKNLTDKFVKPSPVTPVILQEGSNIAVDVAISKKSEEDYGDSEETSIEGLRAPWGGVFPGGPQSQRDALKQGGLIIQRLRVKNGSIAVAGPGGVATAGSGGTAIVGPEGLAITHPRSLTIAGPGARVYEVPESTNLEKQLRSLNADGIPENGVLVAVGPTVHYNSS